MKRSIPASEILVRRIAAFALTLPGIVCAQTAPQHVDCDAPGYRGSAMDVLLPRQAPSEFQSFQVSYAISNWTIPAGEVDVSVVLDANLITLRPHQRAAVFENAPSNLPPSPPLRSVTVPGLAAGDYRLRVEDGNGLAQRADGTSSTALLATTCFRFTVAPSGTRLRAQSLVYGETLRYFLSVSQTEVDAILGSSSSRLAWIFPPWQATDAGFLVWENSASAPEATVPVCRYFNSKVGTHFYSASASDCAALAGQPDWTYEGTPFRTLLPVSGVCGLGTDPVYRLFNTRRSNHRYTPSAETYRSLVGNNGWVGEGVAFCSPKG